MAIPIKRYNTDQTGAKSQLGGEKKGLFIPLYQIGMASLVILLDKKPIAKQRIIPRVVAIISCDRFLFILA